MTKTIEEFKSFHERVEKYYPLENERYLIVFKDGSFEFYIYDKKGRRLIKESTMKMAIENTPAYCPVCGELRANDEEVEKCIESHKIHTH